MQPRTPASRGAATRTQAARAVVAPVAAPRTAEPPRAAAATSPAATPKSASSANILNAHPAQPTATPARPAASAPARSSDDGIPEEAIVGLVAVLGLGAAGYLALRWRRRPEESEAEEVYVAGAPLQPEAIEEDIERAPRTAPVFGMAPDTATASDVRYGFAPAYGHAGDAQVIEREPPTIAPPVAPTRDRSPALARTQAAPASAEERSALIERMVSAAPDEANPFTSSKARRKRARLLLQQHEREARAETPFDWRSYRSQTQRSIPADPELVTA